MAEQPLPTCLVMICPFYPLDFPLFAVCCRNLFQLTPFLVYSFCAPSFPLPSLLVLSPVCGTFVESSSLTSQLSLQCGLIRYSSRSFILRHAPLVSSNFRRLGYNQVLSTLVLLPHPSFSSRQPDTKHYTKYPNLSRALHNLHASSLPIQASPVSATTSSSNLSSLLYKIIAFPLTHRWGENLCFRLLRPVLCK